MNDLDKERQTEGRKAWYAVQTFYCKEEHLGKYLEKKGVNYFIPMRYIEHETLDGKKHRKLTPAVYRERIYGKRTFRKGKRLYYTFFACS